MMFPPFSFSNFFASGTMMLILAMYIISFAFMIWMLVDAGKHDKFWWIVVIISFPFVGALIYYFTEKRKLYEKVK